MGKESDNKIKTVNQCISASVHQSRKKKKKRRRKKEQEQEHEEHEEQEQEQEQEQERGSRKPEPIKAPLESRPYSSNDHPSFL